jgi:hypothetical protein
MRRAPSLGLVAAALALAATGCGSDDHPNENRPPSPIEMTAKITKGKVSIDPGKVGAGLANVTVANLSPEPVSLTFQGPDTTTGNVIAPGNVGTIKVALVEGTYTVSPGAASNAAPDRLVVGPERPSSQNELLLP